ncbi:MAG: hypothetical protein R6U93_08280 [Dehalococcoidia bacterium]
MKTMLRALTRDEKGGAFVLTLVLLLVGGLIMASLLAHMGTGQLAGQVHENKMYEFYAADAGIEEALWCLLSDERLGTKFYPGYTPFDPDWTVDSITWPQAFFFDDPVNNKEVEVFVDRIWLLDGLLGLPSSQPPGGNTANANDRYRVIGALSVDENLTYILDITTEEDADAHVDHIGVWLPPGYVYVVGSTQINGVPIDDHHLVTEPQSMPHLSGTALIWTFEGESFSELSGVAPDPEGGCMPGKSFPHTLRLSFDYDYPSDEDRQATGFFPWISFDAMAHIAWDSEAGMFQIRSRAADDISDPDEKGTTIETYSPRSVRRYTTGAGGAASSVQGDFIAIGNSLMTSAWHTMGGTSCSNYYDPVTDPDYTGTYYIDTCRNVRGSLWDESSATIGGDAVPADARIERAYLYWTAWWWDDEAPGGATLNGGADTEVILKVNDQYVGPDGTGGTVVADVSHVVPIPEILPGYQYSCFADVTGLVKEKTTDVIGTRFTVGGVAAVPATHSDSSNLWLQAANAGWSMVIIYSSAEKESHQIYLYHDMPVGLRNASAEFTVAGFRAPDLGEGDISARVAVFVAEGDAHITPEYMRFKGQQSADFHYLGDDYSGAPNPWNNVFNAYSTAVGFTPSDLPGQASGQISGVDIDSYTADKNGVPLSDIVQPLDTNATIRLTTSNDYIVLVYVVFSVRSTLAPSPEGFHVGAMTFDIQ